MHYGAAGGHQEVCRLLCEFACDVNAPLPDLSTPLMLAVDDGYLAVARLLLARGASARCKDEDGFDCLERCDPRYAEEFAACLQAAECE